MRELRPEEESEKSIRSEKRREDADKGRFGREKGQKRQTKARQKEKPLSLSLSIFPMPLLRLVPSFWLHFATTLYCTCQLCRRENAPTNLSKLPS